VAKIDPTTIDQIDPKWYQQYARLVKEVESTYSDFGIRNLDEASMVPPHTWVESLENLVSMTDLLVGTADPFQKTWAFFTRPPKLPRQSPFTYFLIGPCIGSHEKQSSDAERIANFPISFLEDEDEEEDEGDGELTDEKKEASKKSSRLEKRRKGALEDMFGVLGFINRWLLEIKGYQSQYQKG
jgi:hypothetical protein